MAALAASPWRQPSLSQVANGTTRVAQAAHDVVKALHGAVGGQTPDVAAGTVLVAPRLDFPRGAVLACFPLMPCSGAVHGFFRMAALIRDAPAGVR